MFRRCGINLHTVRRSSRFWAELWTDLTIEQVMMRSIKSRGGLTRGRGVTESVRTLWINTAHRCSTIHKAVTDLTGLKHRTSEQHVEMSSSRKKKDNKLMKRLKEWFAANNPFDPSCPELRSLSSGTVATETDNINCDDVEKVGKRIQETLGDTNVSSATIKRKDQVRTLACLQNGVRIRNNTVYIKPDMLFSRMSILVNNQNERTHFFDYELTPEPSALFVNGKMRKAAKHKLRNHLLKLDDSLPDPCPDVYVIDGGDLLYHTSWNRQSTFEEVALNYLRYIGSNFTNCIVWIIFDGYSHKDSTKSEEHLRRYGGKAAANVNFRNPKMRVMSSKQEFLQNKNNKMQLIQFLKRTFENVGINVKLSIGDADVMICQAALELAEEGKSVVVSGQDTDLLIVLLHHWRVGMKLYFRTTQKNDAKRRTWWSVGQIAQKLEDVKDYILFAHIWGGCDTTSATYQQGEQHYRIIIFL